MNPKRLILILVVLLVLSAGVRADIFRWDNGAMIPGTEGIAPGPGVQLRAEDCDEPGCQGLSDPNSQRLRGNCRNHVTELSGRVIPN